MSGDVKKEIQQDTDNKKYFSYRRIGNVQGQWQFINSNITMVGKSRTWSNVSPKKSRRQNNRVFRQERNM